MLSVFVVFSSLILFGCTQIITQGDVSGSSESVSSDLTDAFGDETEGVTESSGNQEISSESGIEQSGVDDTSYAEATSGEASSSSESEGYETVDLSIDMPEPNGTMFVSSDADNKYIKKVVSEREIDPSLLAAVYSVPESGQNYVFEFYSAGERSANNIRRVFFINSSGMIESVVASKSTERENISATENWFSMNVLIKQMIFPAVKDRM